MKKLSLALIVAFAALSVLGSLLTPGFILRSRNDVPTNSIDVSFSWPGASARTIEQQATSVIEGSLSTIKGVQHIQSQTTKGSATIELSMADNTDMHMARFMVSTVIARIADKLPVGVTYPEVSIKKQSGSANPITIYLYGPHPPDVLAEYAVQYTKCPLGSLSGVAAIEIEPVDKSLQIGVAPDYLRQHDITPQQILQQFYLHDGLPDDMPLKTQIEVSSCATRINGQNAIAINILPKTYESPWAVSKAVRQCVASLTLPVGCAAYFPENAGIELGHAADTSLLYALIFVIVLLAICMIWPQRRLLTAYISLGLVTSTAISAAVIRWLGVPVDMTSMALLALFGSVGAMPMVFAASGQCFGIHKGVSPAILGAAAANCGVLAIIALIAKVQDVYVKDYVAGGFIILAVTSAVCVVLMPALASKWCQAASGYVHCMPLSCVADIYRAAIGWLGKHKWLTSLVAVLLFGLPVFLLPDKLDGNGRFAKLYNSTLGSTFYNRHLRPAVDRTVGGTLRLFADCYYRDEKVQASAYNPRITATFRPFTDDDYAAIDLALKCSESFLAPQTGISTFVTDVRRGTITITFADSLQNTSYPFRLKKGLIDAVSNIAGGGWNVAGAGSDVFDNNIEKGAGEMRITMRGYNYDALTAYAYALSDTLLKSSRIKQVFLGTGYVTRPQADTAYYMLPDQYALSRDSLKGHELFETMPTGRRTFRGQTPVRVSGQYLPINVAVDYALPTAWDFVNTPLPADSLKRNLKHYTHIVSRAVPDKIVKRDQEYVLTLQYDYLGTLTAAKQHLDKVLARYAVQLPPGYTLRNDSVDAPWQAEKRSLWLLLAAIAVVFFVSAVSFNSLVKPLALMGGMFFSLTGCFAALGHSAMHLTAGGLLAMLFTLILTMQGGIYVLSSERKNVGPAFAVLATIVAMLASLLIVNCICTLDTQWAQLATTLAGGLVSMTVALFVLVPVFSSSGKGS